MAIRSDGHFRCRRPFTRPFLNTRLQLCGLPIGLGRYFPRPTAFPECPKVTNRDDDQLTVLLAVLWE